MRCMEADANEGILMRKQLQALGLANYAQLLKRVIVSIRP